MIKIIFFDFDGVLTTDNSGSLTTCKNIQQHLPELALDKILKCYKIHHDKLLVGTTTHKAIWNDFCRCLDKNLNVKILNEAFKNTPINEKILSLCKKLKLKYRLGIITDNNKERFNLIKKPLKLSTIFNPIIVSGETGIKKNDAKTFTNILKLLKFNPHECLFIDNNIENLNIPKKMRWKTIHYDTAKNDLDKLLKVLNEYGISVNF